MLYWMVQIIISSIARIILWVMGWQLPDVKVFDKFNKYDRLVVIFSHTTYLDFFLMILLQLAYPYEFRNLRTIVKPQPFQYLGPILTALGAIPSTRVDAKGEKAVDRIVTELNKQDKFVLMISPKGTIEKKPWRTGYYYIAQALKADLLVGGADYEKKEIIISDSISWNHDQPVIEAFLKTRLTDIVPLFPEDEIVDIRPHVKYNVGVINGNRLLIILVTLWVLHKAIF